MNRKCLFIFVLVFAAWLIPRSSFAATLHFTPTSGNYGVGDTFSVGVLVTSTDQSVNAYDGTVTFPNDILQVVGVSKVNSIVSFWVSDPSYSNAAGTVTFEGVTPNPGFVGAGGRIITITFRVKNEGTAGLRFSDGHVLANDGTGSDVLSTRGTASFTLAAAEEVPVRPTPEPTSSSKSPSVLISFIKPDDPAASKARFKISVLNKTSPIDHYEMSIDGTLLPQWIDDGSGTYETPILAAGKHTLTVKAIDKKEQSYVGNASFEIIGIEPPVITDYSKKLSTLDLVIIKGTTKYPFNLVTVYFDKKDGERHSQSITTDKDGVFNLVLDTKLEEGTYSVTADVSNDKGSKSAPSVPVSIDVSKSGVVSAGWTLIQVLSLLIGVVLLAVILTVLIMYSWLGAKRLRRRLRKEIHAVEDTVHKSISFVITDLLDHVEKLEHAKGVRKLSKEEEDIFSSVEKHLEDLERFVKKEIHTVEKDIG